jgi:predicted TIM-barrel fold metal-dependent hydrolase
MDMCAPQFRDVNFIVPHLGSFAGDWRVHQHVIDLIVRHPNVYTDTSSVRHYDYIVQAVKRGGPRKVIFGSDGPWIHPGVELEKIRLLRLPPEAEGLILGGNVLRLMSTIRRVALMRKTPRADREREERRRQVFGALYSQDGTHGVEVRESGPR